MDTLEHNSKEQQLERLSDLLKSGALHPVRHLLNTLRPGEISDLLESIPPNQRKLAWRLVDPEVEGEVLVEMGEEARASLIENMSLEELFDATEGLATDDLADLIQNLPDTLTDEFLRLMSHHDRERLESVLAFDEDTAGGLMDTDLVTVRTDVTIEVVLRYLRLRGELPKSTDSLIVVNRDDQYIGMLPLETVVTSVTELSVAEVMRQDIPCLQVDTPANEVAQLFETHDLVSIAVTNEVGRLLGRITVDDVVDVIREEAEHTLLSRAGLNEDDDIFAPVFPSARRRALWLGINLLTAILAAWVISLFQATLEKVVALAVLMPIVASMGGIAGTQTLTIVIRGLALGQIANNNARWLLFKELSVGLLNGFFWAGIVALISIAWFKSLYIGGIIAAAMVTNLICAALAGVTIPLIMRSLSIDPALAGGVVLTTVTDVVGFLTFLGLATLIL